MMRIMKNFYTLIAILLLASNGNIFAQVGIGTAAPNGALDIVSSNDGLLIPRIALANTTTATVLTPTISELVYNTATVNDVMPGYYYWDGAKWVRLQAGAKNEWSLTGNAGTVPGTNFLGTTDPVDLRIKTGNADRFNFTSNGRLRSYDNGTQALPTYSWNGDLGTGFWRPAANTLAFSTNSTEKVRITSSGQLAVGTIAPDASAILDVKSSSKGVSFPNINLTSETDFATITSPAPGLMVYNTNASMPCGKGLYFNNGTAIAPVWSCFTKTVQQYHAYNTAARVVAIGNTTQTLQPGCTINFTVPTGQIADVKIDGVLGAITSSTLSGRYAAYEVIVYVDGSFLPQGGWNRTFLNNPASVNTNALGICAFSTTAIGLTAGNHTIALYSSFYAGNSALQIGGNCSTDVNCGEIHAIVTYR